MPNKFDIAKSVGQTVLLRGPSLRCAEVNYWLYWSKTFYCRVYSGDQFDEIVSKPASWVSALRIKLSSIRLRRIWPDLVKPPLLDFVSR